MLRLPVSARGIAVLVSLATLGGALGCETRDRLIFPTGPGSGVGPASIIDVPGSDTTITASTAFFLTGLVTDAGGIDTIYFELVGARTAFPPEIDAGERFRFGLPLNTVGQEGDTILVRVFATDRAGNRGDTATRQIVVQ